MKKATSILLLSSLFFACEESPKDIKKEEVATAAITETPAVKNATYYASYVGAFEAAESLKDDKGTYSNLINITITNLENGQATGRSIIAGNDRPFKGSYQQKGAIFDIVATEPGDDKHDGRFECRLDTNTHTLSGKWFCNDSSIAVPVRTFELKKREFVYKAENNFKEGVVGLSLYNGSDMDEGGYEAITEKVTKINASTTKLGKKDVENLYKGDLEIIRNAIYARHGYSFRNRRMRYFFDNNVDWYMPMNVDVRNQLSDLEKENIDLLKRYENHAEKYYDEYSR